MAEDFGVAVLEHTILGLLGQGGMARVYLARDETFGRLVALKVIDTRFDTDRQFVERFEREARTAGGLAHPHIVPVHRFGRTADGRPYLTMAYIEGGSLRDRLRQHTTLPIDEALRITKMIAGALHAAHRRRIVHRDLKPDNILFQGDVALLADFGIAKLLDAETELTEAGVHPGTVRYFSPEQAQARPLDARSDIYALGVVLFEMLVGRRPIDGDSLPHVLMRIVQAQPEPLPEQLRGLQSFMDALLAKDPRNRLASCEEIVELIDGMLSNWARHQDPAQLTAGLRIRAGAVAETAPPSEELTLVLPTQSTRDASARQRAEVQPRAASAAVANAPTEALTDRLLPPATRAPPNNLPQQLTSFIGRDRELLLAYELLANTRIVTVVGPGGIGKTRLCLQLAATVADGVADGIWFVELAATADPAHVPGAVARVLGLPESGDAPTIAALCDFLRTRELLLLLDNCEHLIDACASLVDSLLRTAPKLRVLASSREALDVAGEQIFRLPPLALPEVNAGAAPTADSDAAQLFIARARLRQPEFRLTEKNARAIASICIRLDGIPLALELAAARIGVLGVDAIAERLNDRFRLLTGGSRTALPRQQTLRALIDWSYDLLAPAERILLCRLSVFAGGSSLTAVEQIGASNGLEAGDVLDLLMSLTHKSLVVVDEHGSRYRMLETIRDYARDRLQESTQLQAVRDRHCAFFTELALAAEPHLEGGPLQPAALAELELEHDNLRAALTCSLAEHANHEASLRICGAIYRFWAHRGHAVEGRAWCTAALAATVDGGGSTARLKALHAAGTLEWRLGDVSAARRLLEDALALARELGDRAREGRVLNNLGGIAIHQGDAPAARVFLERAADMHRLSGDRALEARALNNLAALAIHHDEFIAAQRTLERALVIIAELDNPMEEATALSHLGTLAQRRRDFVAARELHERALATARAFGVREFELDEVRNLGEVAFAQADSAAAAAHYCVALEIAREIGNQREIVVCLEAIATLLVSTGSFDSAALLCGVADSAREAIATPRTGHERDRYDTTLARCDAALGANTTLARIAAGRIVSFERTIADALSWIAPAQGG